MDNYAVIPGIIAAFLRRRDYQVQQVASAKAAVEKMQANNFDVVITDQDLPGEFTSIEVLARHSQLTPSGVRIFLAAVGSAELKAFCQKIDSLYVQKPVAPKELVDQIESLVASRVD
jgi:DNA-binding response OmpR family regulator